MYNSPACLIGATYTRSSNEQQKENQEKFLPNITRNQTTCLGGQQGKGGRHPEIDQKQREIPKRGSLHQTNMADRPRHMETQHKETHRNQTHDRGHLAEVQARLHSPVRRGGGQGDRIH